MWKSERSGSRDGAGVTDVARDNVRNNFDGVSAFRIGAGVCIMFRRKRLGVPREGDSGVWYADMNDFAESKESASSFRRCCVRDGAVVAGFGVEVVG